MSKQPPRSVVVVPATLCKLLGWPAVRDLESLDRRLCEAWGRAVDATRSARETYNTACATMNCAKAMLARAEAHEEEIHAAIQVVRKAADDH